MSGHMGDMQEVTAGVIEGGCPCIQGGTMPLALGGASWALLGRLWPVLRDGAEVGRGPGACKVEVGMHPVPSVGAQPRGEAGRDLPSGSVPPL